MQNFFIPEIGSPEHAGQVYRAAMDSVNLINELKAKPTLTEEEQTTLSNNQQHLRVILAYDFWTTENLEPFRQASK